MIGEPVQLPARALLVGDDAEVISALQLHLARAGWAPFCVPCPELLEALLPPIAPQAIVLVLPASPGTAWGSALTAAATAARSGVRVVVVAPAREVVEPLAAVAGAERALARSDVLARPLSVLERAPGPRLPPPLPAPASASTGTGSSRSPPRVVPTPTPLSLTPTMPARAGAPITAPGGLHARSGLPVVDLAALIEEELVDEPRSRPKVTRIDVTVSLVSEHNFYVGATKRVDSGGLFISTMLPPPVGTPLEIRLALPDGRMLDVAGEVVFVRDRSAVTGRQPAGCGVKLSALPTWASDAIDRFLAARPPILYLP